MIDPDVTRKLRYFATNSRLSYPNLLLPVVIGLSQTFQEEM